MSRLLRYYGTVFIRFWFRLGTATLLLNDASSTCVIAFLVDRKVLTIVGFAKGNVDNDNIIIMIISQQTDNLIVSLLASFKCCVLIYYVNNDRYQFRLKLAKSHSLEKVKKRVMYFVLA